jgi:hypothetical protein
MKFLTNSTGNPKRLFVPVNEFVFNGFAVRVRRLASRPTRALRGEFSVNQQDARRLLASSPIPAAV